jgi:hypothetical protein
MRGQLSAEMLILLVLVLALVAIAFTYMTKAVNTAGEGAQAKTDDALKVGDFCSTPNDCGSNNLDCDATGHCAYKTK